MLKLNEDQIKNRKLWEYEEKQAVWMTLNSRKELWNLKKEKKKEEEEGTTDI